MKDERIERILFNLKLLNIFAMGMESLYVHNLANEIRKDLKDFLISIYPNFGENKLLDCGQVCKVGN